MLALSPATRDESRIGERGEGDGGYNDDFTINSSDELDLLDSIDFDDLFNGTGDLLPDLEIDPESLSSVDYFSDHLRTCSTTDYNEDEINKSLSDWVKGEEVVSKREDKGNSNGERKRKYPSKNNKSSNEGKRKVKVDWTGELHRRFVEAVETLGVEKAVPSRILDLMGIHSLTRHNVASHLQKYRCHRKHLVAREAEAANWTRKRNMYTGGASDTCRKTASASAWLAPTIGFPPLPPRVLHHPPHFRPNLHVWGHPTPTPTPTVDQSLIPHLCPKHLPPPSTAVVTPPFWISDPPYWQQIHTGTTPYFPTVATRFRVPPIAGIPHHAMYKTPNGFGAAVAGQSAPRPPPVDLHPSKESVDAAIGDVLTQPWLPLPLGLKPPAVDGVMAELHRHGVSQVPPTTPDLILN